MTTIDENDNDDNWAEVDISKDEEEPTEKPEIETDNETDAEDSGDDVEVVLEEDPEELDGVKTKGAEKRIRQLVQQRNERDNVLTQMGGEIDQLRSELIKSQRTTKAHEVSSLASRETELEERAKVAEKDYLRAFDEGEQEKVLEAQNIINDARTDLKIVKARRIQLENLQHRDEILAAKDHQDSGGYTEVQQQNRNEQQSITSNQPDKLAVDWASTNNWFGKDEVSTAVALALDQKLKGEGYDPTSKEFYNEIDKRLQQELPNKFGTDRVTDNTNKPSQVVAGSSRKSSPKGSKVKLSKRDVQLAKKWDIPLDRYAAEKRKLTKLDEGNYSTIETKRV